jgi:hypothetical protein
MLHPLDEAAAAPPPPPPLGTNYDPNRTGAIQGQVKWDGPIPEIHSFRDAKVSTPAMLKKIDPKNPLAPKINREGNGLLGAVVFLRKVDPARSKPWDLGAARVEINDGNITVNQGDSGPYIVGFVRNGDAVEMISHSKGLEIVRARGDAFFSLTFPEPEKELSRPFTKPGLVELTGAVGNFWARSYLFVAEHPYYTRTDANGHFKLENVPEGEYELALWIPNWKTERFERDPENLYVARLWFCPPVVWVDKVRVEAGGEATKEFSVRNGDFWEKK